MPLTPLPSVDTRAYFRPVSSALLPVLHSLTPDDWQRSTLAGRWTVRDVLAHLVDVTFRRVSFNRDRMPPPPPPFAIHSDRDFVRFINGLNHDWVSVSRRLSPQVLTELFDVASGDLATFVESRTLENLALFGVSWAGEMRSDGWFDIGREFTELWHHQMQIRLAVGAPPLDDPRYLRAVLDISMRALPHAYREIEARVGATLVLDVSGPAGGVWTLRREADGWTLWSGRTEEIPSAQVQLSDDSAWRLLYNALPAADAVKAVRFTGVAALADPVVRVRSIVI